jgi:hypothetical protein
MRKNQAEWPWSRALLLNPGAALFPAGEKCTRLFENPPAAFKTLFSNPGRHL